MGSGGRAGGACCCMAPTYAGAHTPPCRHAGAGGAGGREPAGHRPLHARHRAPRRHRCAAGAGPRRAPAAAGPGQCCAFQGHLSPAAVSLHVTFLCLICPGGCPVPCAPPLQARRTRYFGWAWGCSWSSWCSAWRRRPRLEEPWRGLPAAAVVAAAAAVAAAAQRCICIGGKWQEGGREGREMTQWSSC